jgi:hypothetical protein
VVSQILYCATNWRASYDGSARGRNVWVENLLQKDISKTQFDRGSRNQPTLEFILNFHSYPPALNTCVPFIVSPSLAALSAGNPALAGTSRDSCSVHGHDRRSTLRLEIILYTLGLRFHKRQNKISAAWSFAEYCNKAVQWNQRDALFIQFIKN